MFTNCHGSNPSVKHCTLEGFLLLLDGSSDLREHCDVESEPRSETQTTVADAGPADGGLHVCIVRCRDAKREKERS